MIAPKKGKSISPENASQFVYSLLKNEGFIHELFKNCSKTGKNFSPDGAAVLPRARGCVPVEKEIAQEKAPAQPAGA